MNKKALLIAFHFPPAAGSSGIHRATSLARYLPEFGWDPYVLTVKPGAYPQIAPGHTDTSDTVFRCGAFDAARHLSIRGAYPDFFAWPDRWVSWWPTGVLKALSVIRSHRPNIIWTTYPITTAMLIGLTTQRITKLPWVADLRDSMTDDAYPPEKHKRRIYEWIESKTVQNATRVVFTAPGTRKLYSDRFPDAPTTKWETILNGFDEERFADATSLTVRENTGPKLVFLHSGIIYPKERDPTSLFRALSQLQDLGQISETNFELRLRATGHDEKYGPMIQQLKLDKLVKLLPSLEYREALAEMMSVDGLILLQAKSCNHQIPAKAYEYARAKRPILGLTDRLGDTAGLLTSIGNSTIAPLDSPSAIKAAFESFIERVRNRSSTFDDSRIQCYSRREQARRTAAIFDQLGVAPT